MWESMSPIAEYVTFEGEKGMWPSKDMNDKFYEYGDDGDDDDDDDDVGDNEDRRKKREKSSLIFQTN